MKMNFHLIKLNIACKSNSQENTFSPPHFSYAEANTEISLFLQCKSGCGGEVSLSEYAEADEEAMMRTLLIDSSVSRIVRSLYPD